MFNKGNCCVGWEKSYSRALSKLNDDLSAEGQFGRQLHDYYDRHLFSRTKKFGRMLKTSYLFYQGLYLKFFFCVCIKESISTCRFAQRVALIKNEALVNEELDPRLVIDRLKREVDDLRNQLAINNNTDITIELTLDEIEK